MASDGVLISSLSQRYAWLHTVELNCHFWRTRFSNWKIQVKVNFLLQQITVPLICHNYWLILSKFWAVHFNSQLSCFADFLSADAQKINNVKKPCDHAMRCVCRHLFVNCCTTVGTSCTTNSQQIVVIEIEGYRWPTCSEQPRRVDRRKCRQQARPSTSFVDNTSDLRRRNFPSSEFGKFQREYPLWQREYPRQWESWRCSKVRAHVTDYKYEISASELMAGVDKFCLDQCEGLLQG